MTYKNTTCAAIVCAYNEEKTIAGVVAALQSSPLLDEIIIVDDGSSDGTPEILNQMAHEARTQVVLLPKNQGKGYAMACGVSHSKAEVLVTIDADLTDLTSEHISLMLVNYLTYRADLLIAYPIRGAAINRIERLDPYQSLAGQRVFRRCDFLPILQDVQYSGYGVETIMNLYFRKHHKQVKKIHLPYLIHPIKIEKARTPREAAEMYWHEGMQIAKTTVRNLPLVVSAYAPQWFSS